MHLEGKHLKSRHDPESRRPQATLALALPEHQAIWAAARVRAHADNLTLSSLVIQALAEYMERHPEANHA